MAYRQFDSVFRTVFVFAMFAASAISFSANAAGTNRAFIGFETGYLNKGGVSGSEVTNSGFEYGVRGSWNRLTDKSLYDVGLGWRSDSLENSGVSVSTKAFFGDLSYRYRITPALSVGPSVTTLLGQDVSFSDVGTNSDEKSLAVFGGVRATYDFNWKNRFVRVGMNFNTDLNIAERQVSAVQMFFEVGLPFGAPAIVVADKADGREKSEVAEPAAAEPLKLNLMNAGVRFKTGSSVLAGESGEIIRNIAKTLVNYKGEWASINIEGHTDHLGKYRENIYLSRARAYEVKKHLVEHGVQEALVHTTGYGPDKPLAKGKDRQSRALNRRVELRITGTNASAEFAQDLKAVLSAN